MVDSVAILKTGAILMDLLTCGEKPYKVFLPGLREIVSSGRRNGSGQPLRGSDDTCKVSVDT